MEDRYAKFTERAKFVLTQAQVEAVRLKHTYIGTEHLLLGLVREGDGVAARVLNNLGVDFQKVQAAIESLVGVGSQPPTDWSGLTPRSKRVIELAVDETRRLNHYYTGTEHLLLGLVREGEGIAAGVLESLGVSLEKVRQQVIQVLNQSSRTQKENEIPGTEKSLPDRPEPINNSNRFEVFNESARLVLTRAQEEAQRYNHNYIGTEHFLLGLIRDETSLAARVLGEMGVPLPKIRSAVDFIIGRGDRAIMGEIDLTPRAKRVIDLTFKEAQRMNLGYIGPEHILLGLIAEGEGIAAGVLLSLNVELEPTRQRVKQIVDGRSSG